MENVTQDVELAEMGQILYGLASEISAMSEEEKLVSLESLVQAELDGTTSRFWTTVAKKMLVSDEFANQVILTENLRFSQNLAVSEFMQQPVAA